MRRLVLLMLPVVSALLALAGQGLGWKLGVPFACAMALVALLDPRREGRRALWWVVAAFAFSMAGDYFLSSRRGRESYFLYGIAAFWVAHLGYLAYALTRGRVHVHALILLLAGYLTYHFRMVAPAIESPVLSGAVLAYLLVSCVSMAAAIGMKTNPGERWLYVAGVALILFSDTVISFREFLNFHRLNALILPAYYLAQILILHGVLLRRDLRYT
ncbi:MAG: hypothetical protein KJZ84_10305 [Bryobacteraceae bacterium]|nr:hypothetical protein [Bryobacteraceae bacterium]